MRFFICFCLIPYCIHSTLLEVAIIGAGHAGKGLFLALQEQGIQNVAIFESAVNGQESIWLTTARMKTLRSTKDCVGPALSIPHLTFRAWYEAQGGAWDDIVKIPTKLWGEYLQWFTEALNLPIYYRWNLIAIEPGEENSLRLIFDQGREIQAKKVILATGRDSFGGLNIPPLVQQLPKVFWHHTSERIDSSLLAQKKICIIGAAASAFDLAATALEAGAVQVDMLMRRDEVKTKNYLALYFNNWTAYYDLPDEEKIFLIHNAFQHGFCPPIEAVERIADNPQFHLHFQTIVENFSWTEDSLIAHTNQGDFQTDHLFIATGFKCDPFLVPQIASFADKILLWRDKVKPIPAYLGLFPYLDKSFAFLEKEPGSFPFLKNIHCFNYGSYLTHGNTGIDIDQFHIGAERLAEAIAMEIALIKTNQEWLETHSSDPSISTGKK